MAATRPADSGLSMRFSCSCRSVSKSYKPSGDPAEAFYWIDADQATQLAYLQRVVDDCDYLNAEFLCWFLTRDYDEAWDEYYQHWSSAPTLRIWRDTGLYNGYGDARPALAEWHQTLVRPLTGRRP